MGDTPDILKKIVARKWQEVAERRERLPLGELESLARQADGQRGFAYALQQRVAAGHAEQR